METSMFGRLQNVAASIKKSVKFSQCDYIFAIFKDKISKVGYVTLSNSVNRFSLSGLHQNLKLP